MRTRFFCIAVFAFGILVASPTSNPDTTLTNADDQAAIQAPSPLPPERSQSCPPGHGDPDDHGNDGNGGTGGNDGHDCRIDK